MCPDFSEYQQRARSCSFGQRFLFGIPHVGTLTHTHENECPYTHESRQRTNRKFITFWFAFATVRPDGMAMLCFCGFRLFYAIAGAPMPSTPTTSILDRLSDTHTAHSITDRRPSKRRTNTGYKVLRFAVLFLRFYWRRMFMDLIHFNGINHHIW